MRKLGRFISEVYRILDDSNSPATAGEVFAVYQSKFPATKRSRGEVAKRLTDLMNAGLVSKVGTTTCQYSGCAASTWGTLGLNDLDLSDEPAEETVAPPESGCDCSVCSCREEEEEEEVYNDVATMSRDEKARRITELAGEECAAVDPEDLAFLRECRQALGSIDSNPIARLVLASIPGMKDKADRLKKALRYFG